MLEQPSPWPWTSRVDDKQEGGMSVFLLVCISLKGQVVPYITAAGMSHFIDLVSAI